ncbi:hypothetical protein GN958_ATG06409, partial [Phytophthora infestans]
SCCVTSANINSFQTKKNGELRLAGLHLVEALKGTLGPLTSSYVPTLDWCTLTLSQKHSTYFMKLKLDCQIGCMRGCWSFPMNPDDPGSIQKRALDNATAR